MSVLDAPVAAPRRRRLLDLEALEVEQSATGETMLTKPPELSWWDWTIFLLHTATEIEHALLVQYLYAAYSLADEDFSGLNVPVDAGTITAGWRDEIVGIAEQEMGHLLTEQNVLRLLDGPTNLEREDFPFRTGLYPFAFELEPMSRASLAKYVAAEMPAAPDPVELPADELAEIQALAGAAAGGAQVNRVGQIFATLEDVLADPGRIPDSDLRIGHIDQQAPEDWSRGFPLIVRLIPDRATAVQAIHDIGLEGEGAGAAAGPDTSHFARFLAIFRAFPRNDGVAGPDWNPARAVPVNPTTSSTAQPGGSPITHPATRLWAQLFNARYRMLLTDLGHALRLSGPNQVSGASTPRGTLRDWTFREMTTALGPLAAELRTRRLTDAPEDTSIAAAPFEMPASVALPDTEHAVWRLHAALLDNSTELITAIRAAEGDHPVLQRLSTFDGQARTVVTAQLAAT